MLPAIQISSANEGHQPLSSLPPSPVEEDLGERASTLVGQPDDDDDQSTEDLVRKKKWKGKGREGDAPEGDEGEEEEDEQALKDGRGDEGAEDLGRG